MKNIYEIFDEFEAAGSKEDKINVLKNNLSQVLVDVLILAYHPKYEWLVNEMPIKYKLPDVLPGSSFSSLSKELRKFYMFQRGEPTAEKLTDKRREELLLQILESLEFREAEVVIGIFSKDLGVKGLDYKFIKKVFPDILP
jgi:hypothetical protein